MALGVPEFMLILGVALLLFGPNKLPELARALGQATQKYKEGLAEAKGAIFEEPHGSRSSEDREIIAAAEEMGIPTKNRSIEEIAEDLIANS